VPRLLPAAVADFTGRAAELAALTGMLERAGAGMPGTVVISAIGGTAGVGKTSLGLYWSHQVADRFPDGQLHVNLRGFDPSGSPSTPAEAIRGFLDALGVPPDRIPPAPEAQAGMYRSQDTSRFAAPSAAVAAPRAGTAGGPLPGYGSWSAPGSLSGGARFVPEATSS